MTAKHTPGPWTTGPNMPLLCRINGGHRIYMNGSGSALAYSMGSGAAETEANARLIAAAPTMYEEAKALLAALDREHSDQLGVNTAAAANRLEAVLARVEEVKS